MKFIHCSDLHLGRRPVGGVGAYSQKRYDDYFNAFNTIVTWTLEKGADALLIGGDLFDKKELQPVVLEKTEKILLRLKEKSIPVVAIEGNHDNIIRGKEDESWLIYLEKKELLQRPYSYYGEDGFSTNPVIIDGYHFFGLGYPGFMINEIIEDFSTYLEINEVDPERSVALIHTAIAPDEFIPGLTSADTIRKISNKLIYIAGGHLHSYKVFPKEEPCFFIPGAPEYWDLGEKGRRGAILFDTSNKEQQFLEYTPREIIRENCTIQAHTMEEFQEAFKEEVTNFSIISGESILLLTLFISGDYYPDIPWCEEYLKDVKNPLRTEISIKFSRDISSPQEIREGKESLEEIEKRLVEEWEFWGIPADKTVASLHRMKESLMEKDITAMGESFDFLLNSVLEEE